VSQVSGESFAQLSVSTCEVTALRLEVQLEGLKVRMEELAMKLEQLNDEGTRCGVYDHEYLDSHIKFP
jgi:hypothetical protein